MDQGTESKSENLEPKIDEAHGKKDPIAKSGEPQTKSEGNESPKVQELESFDITAEEKEFILRLRETKKMRERVKEQAPKERKDPLSLDLRMEDGKVSMRIELKEPSPKHEVPSGVKPLAAELRGARSHEGDVARDLAKLDLESSTTESLAERYVLFPIEDETAWKFFKLQEASIWHASEIDLAQDEKDWSKLNAGEQQFIETILAFFAGADGIVLENLAVSFYKMAQNPEQKAFYTAQMFIETIHSETYSLLIDVLIKNAKRKKELFEAVDNNPAIKKKAEWMRKWIFNSSSNSEKTFAYAIAEGVFFSAAFCSIFWLRRKGIMPGLSFSNELISRDEGLHCEFGLYRYFCENPLSNERAHEMMREAMEIEEEFIRSALPLELIGMNGEDMIQYSRYCADRLLVAADHAKLFGCKNSFDWMVLIDLKGKTNIFEKRVGEYNKHTKREDAPITGIDMSVEV